MLFTLYRYFLAESKGFFGVLPYAFASLRSLTTDFQTVHRTVFIGEADRPCSNPLLKITQRKTRHSKRYTLFSWRRARDSAHFVRRKVCYANYPDYRLLLTRLRLAKDCKGSNPINNSQKITVQCYSHYTVISWRRARDSNPRNRFGGLHDFQSCSFDQLGQLSVLPVILYTIV